MKKHIAGFAFSTLMLVSFAAPAFADRAVLVYQSGPTYVAPPPVVAYAPAPVWYYCSYPAGYYPYVAQCFAPWQRVYPAQRAAPVYVQPQIVQPAPVVPQPVVMNPGSSVSRDQDDRQLNAFAVEFNAIDMNSPNAQQHLADLQSRVEAYRVALTSRPYNVSDIISDTQILQHRMQSQATPVSQRPPAPMPHPIQPDTSLAPVAPTPATPSMMPPQPVTPPSLGAPTSILPDAPNLTPVPPDSNAAPTPDAAPWPQVTPVVPPSDVPPTSAPQQSIPGPVPGAMSL